MHPRARFSEDSGERRWRVLSLRSRRAVSKRVATLRKVPTRHRRCASRVRRDVGANLRVTEEDRRETRRRLRPRVCRSSCVRFHQSGLQLRTASNGTIRAVVRVATHPPDGTTPPVHIGCDYTDLSHYTSEKRAKIGSRTKFRGHTGSCRSMSWHPVPPACP